MPLFSQRIGLKPLQKEFQRESLDLETRNKLWSGLIIFIFDYYWRDSKIIENLIKNIWLNYFSQAIDTVPKYSKSHAEIRDYFFRCEWFKVLDFMEFIVKNTSRETSELIIKFSNKILTQESSAYRFVDKEIVEITDETEILTAEEALNNDAPYSKHLSRSLEFLSDRKTLDYRNSIKESISAVESMCRIITKNDKAVLSDCLKEIKNKHSLHPAFEQALIKLYGYTSDEGGIRHSFTDKTVDISYSDAKFMFILCCSFINYLNGKLSE